jgi:hypothetical protein
MSRKVVAHKSTSEEAELDPVVLIKDNSFSDDKPPSKRTLSAQTETSWSDRAVKGTVRRSTAFKPSNKGNESNR